MSDKRVRRRMFDRRSGVDRRRMKERIYWPDRRRAKRRETTDRRGLLPMFAGRDDDRGDAPELSRPRLASVAREWVRRLSR